MPPIPLKGNKYTIPLRVCGEGFFVSVGHGERVEPLIALTGLRQAQTDATCFMVSLSNRSSR